MIPTPYYGAITQHVYLYGNIRLAYVYLDSKVRVSASQFLHLSFPVGKGFLDLSLWVGVKGACVRGFGAAVKWSWSLLLLHGHLCKL